MCKLARVHRSHWYKKRFGSLLTACRMDIFNIYIFYCPVRKEDTSTGSIFVSPFNLSPNFLMYFVLYSSYISSFFSANEPGSAFFFGDNLTCHHITDATNGQRQDQSPTTMCTRMYGICEHTIAEREGGRVNKWRGESQRLDCNRPTRHRPLQY